MVRSTLKKRVLVRRNHPTQKINSIIQRRKRMSEKNSNLAKKMSVELIFAETKKKQGIKYAGTGKATISSTELSKKFVSTRRLIHTHPNLVINKKIRQYPNPSLVDISTMFNLKLKTSLIAVLDKGGSGKVAGYLVMRKTKKSEGISREIKQSQKKLFQKMKKNKKNPNYWTNFLIDLTKKKNISPSNKQTLIKSVELIQKEALQLEKIESNYSKNKNSLEHKKNQLFFAQRNNQINQEFFYKEIEKLSKERELIKQEYNSNKIEIKKKMNNFFEREKINLEYLVINQKFVELGLIDLTKKIGNNGLEYSGFFKATPKKEVGKDFFERIDRNKKMFGEKLGLQFRMVPTEGFRVERSEFIKKPIKK